MAQRPFSAGAATHLQNAVKDVEEGVVGRRLIAVHVMEEVDCVEALHGRRCPVSVLQQQCLRGEGRVVQGRGV
jgi:hypothetical protein